ncbi:MAG TPA: TetR/AcrR family transcriptional regulator [Roseiflexaceae bacterium]|nr:TetR/AcrR family transcriptional regulator [Roseiflexaceae bacterium]
MPKPTFENLPTAKRQAIIDLALEEFAERPYAVASISRIVERAGIAKGSIYQYFEHKQDLFLFLLDYAAGTQLRLLGELTPPGPDTGFFELLRWQMSASVRVGAATPLLTRLMHRAAADDLPFRAEVVRRLQGAGAGHFAQLVARGIERGEIDPTADPEIAAVVIQGLLSNLHTLVLQRLGISLQEASADIGRLDSPEAEQIYDEVLRIIRRGLARHT